MNWLLWNTRANLIQFRVLNVKVDALRALMDLLYTLLIHPSYLVLILEGIPILCSARDDISKTIKTKCFLYNKMDVPILFSLKSIGPRKIFQATRKNQLYQFDYLSNHSLQRDIITNLIRGEKLPTGNNLTRNVITKPIVS